MNMLPGSMMSSSSLGIALNERIRTTDDALMQNNVRAELVIVVVVVVVEEEDGADAAEEKEALLFRNISVLPINQHTHTHTNIPDEHT